MKVAGIIPSFSQLILNGLSIVLLGVGIGIAVLAVKALKTYIKKNS